MTWVPQPCTLPTDEQPARVAEFDDLFTLAVAPTQRLGPTHLRLDLPGGSAVEAAVRDLVARESGCCTFFAFTVTAAGGVTRLDVEVPPSRTAVLDAIQRRTETAAAS